MKQIKLSVGVMALIITILRMADVSAQSRQHDNIKEFRERDEIRQSLQLAIGTRVEVASIRGSVEIETANIRVAEIHIVRSAQSREDLDQFKIGIEHTMQGLIIRGETRQRKSGSGFQPDVRHQVTLRLPRKISLSINSVGGRVRIGDVDGQLLVNSVSGSLSVGAVDGQVQVISVSGGVDIGRVNQQVKIHSVSGNVTIGEVVAFLDISGVTGALSVGISKLEQRGIKINSVSGQVELRLRDELNAQLTTNSVRGSVLIDVPNVTMQSRPGASATRALIGKGGPPILITGVSKNVRLAQGT